MATNKIDGNKLTSKIEQGTLQVSEQFNTKNIVKKLETYMDRVTEQNCTPDTVHAAVSCADKIVDILRLHLEVERLNIKRNPK